MPAQSICCAHIHTVAMNPSKTGDENVPTRPKYLAMLARTEPQAVFITQYDPCPVHPII